MRTHRGRDAGLVLLDVDAKYAELLLQLGLILIGLALMLWRGTSEAGSTPSIATSPYVGVAK